ncbi:MULTISPECIES: carboxypeptidase-like regulatory domain-containing protein [Maribacter]|uniref:Carboxypeptidase-like regulatory domain-containing protein n=1 Tax=Maribacter flavus TaxID=1658664 RepID=A0ABU7IHN0_9FLAO|nr:MULTISPECIES: carboxypeptidase-like regulatory domain-containing protein [Maribacter]MDC6405045.1 carboxypeptidase-like regulatory domain-containing protein [Maribacter sp. PR66]MEE1972459.1 carboxypeptidase-like regulatory domain-containing protein [Maribacter flavus]
MHCNRWPILFFLLMASVCWAQEAGFVRGTVLDGETKEPVVFATVRILGKAKGVITNMDGSFRLPLEFREAGESIAITSMGYTKKEYGLQQLSPSDINIIYLEAGVLELSEAVVKAKGKRFRNLNAKQIVQKAIDAIPNNYPATSFSLVGYYRDYQYKDSTYLNLNEGIFEVFDQGFDQLDDSNTESLIYQWSTNTDFPQDSSARQSYNYKSLSKVIEKARLDAHGGNEFRILRIHDAIRNFNVGSYDFIGTMKTDFTKNHYFLRGADTTKDGNELYTIKFRIFFPNYRANGTIYISKFDFAIHRLEYTMYDEKKKGDDKKRNKHGHFQKPIFDITTEYNSQDGNMYLNYISFHNTFILNVPPVFRVDDYAVDFDEQCFTVEYNTRPLEELAMDLKNYDVEFKNRRVKIRTIKRLKNKIYLIPALIDEKKYEIFGEILDAVKKEKDLNELVSIKVSNVRDTLGNLVNKWTAPEYEQYREFFVQEVKPDNRAPFDGLFMDKAVPLFGEQPMDEPANGEYYWMNTPLKKSIN